MINVDLDGRFVCLTSNNNIHYFDDQPPYVINGDTWNLDASISFEGLFYDRIIGSTGSLIGFRYWLLDTDITTHEVLKYFLNDGRFIYAGDSRYIDIVFEFSNISICKNGDFNIQSLQDFGDEMIVRNNRLVGIVWKIE